MKFRIFAATCAAFVFWMVVPASAARIFEEGIPDVPGKSLLVTDVYFAPGQAVQPHIHAKSAFIFAYVISGAIESKVNDAPARIYKAGESWMEPGGAVHSLCRNASKTEPAKLLIINVIGTDDLPRVTIIK